jgi:hypothetical protein
MTDAELRQEWTQEEFEQWKAQGIFGAETTYDEYLAMRREQWETSFQQREALKAYYGDYPNEQPPELTPEEDRILSEVWAELGRERDKAKIAA